MTDQRLDFFGQTADEPERAAEAGARGFSDDSYDEIINEEIRESDQFNGAQKPGSSSQAGGPGMMPPMMMGGRGMGGGAAAPAASGGTPTAHMGSTAVQNGAGSTLGVGGSAAGAGGVNAAGFGPGGMGLAGGAGGGVAGGGVAGGGVAGGLGASGIGAGGLGVSGAMPGFGAGTTSMGRYGMSSYPGGMGTIAAGSESGYGPRHMALGPNGIRDNSFNVDPETLRSEAGKWAEVRSEMDAARAKMASLDVAHEKFGKVQAPAPSYEMAKQTSKAKADASVSRAEQNSNLLSHNASAYEQSDATAAGYTAI